MTLILPPIFERSRERDERIARYATSVAGRESKKRSYKRRFADILEAKEAREPEPSPNSGNVFTPTAPPIPLPATYPNNHYAGHPRRLKNYEPS